MMEQNPPLAQWQRLQATLEAFHLPPGDVGAYAEILRVHGTVEAAHDYPELEQHLRDCATCRLDLTEMMDALSEMDAHELVKSGAISRADQARAALAKSWRLVFRAVRKASVALAPGPSQPVPALDATVRSGPTQRELVEILPGDDQLEVLARREGTGYRMELVLKDSAGQARSGVPVEVGVAGESTPRRASTDAYGEVTFYDLPEEALDTASLRIGAAS